MKTTEDVVALGIVIVMSEMSGKGFTMNTMFLHGSLN